MPPTPASLMRNPNDFAEDTLRLLEIHGILPRIPTIRSSDFNLVNRCRFLYWLQRRMGLVPAFRYSDALSFGSWFHTALQCLQDPPRARKVVDLALESRIQEINGICDTLNIRKGEPRQNIIAAEREDAYTAWAWFRAALSYRRSNDPYTSHGLPAYFSSPWQVLGQEIRMGYRFPETPKCPLVIELDSLVYNPTTKQIWGVEGKTTQLPTIVRGQLIRIEAQPRHYCFVLNELLRVGEIQRHYNLPASTTLGGIFHLIFAKPQIRLSGQDRRYGYANESKRSGLRGAASFLPKLKEWHCSIYQLDSAAPHERKKFSTEEKAIAYLEATVTTQAKKVFQGEPDPSLYAKRCQQWYTATGDYADRRNEIAHNPPVLVSTTPAEVVLDEDKMNSYFTQLHRVYKYATLHPVPCQFDMHTDGATSMNGLSPYAPFYTTMPRQWPDIIRRDNFIQQFRDEDIDPARVLDYAVDL